MPYIEVLDRSNSLCFKLMLIEGSLVGKESRCNSLVRYLVLDRTSSGYVVPTVSSYVSCNGKKNEGELWDDDAYLYPVMTPRMYGSVICYALWHK